ncbi:MAG TPA: methyltransferase domain-containing protein [Pyrinomonadaceae bacterium]|nr:methyltransferase domain-containing protein [Pyrinomonadaceae bacterium]
MFPVHQAIVILKPVKIINPEYTVEKIVERMRDGARQAHALDDWVTAESENESSTRQVSVNGNLTIQPLTLQPEFEPAADDRYHVNDLLKFHDRAFLQNAYRAILKRVPDEAGYSGFSEALKSGRLNKIDILARLRYSPEGRAKRVRVRGLLAPAALRTTYRIPLIGYFLNLLVALLRLPVMVKHHRQFETHILGQQQTMVDQINHLVQSVMARADDVAGRLTSYRESFTRLGVDMQAQIESLRDDQASNHEVVLERVGDLTNYVEGRFNEETQERRQELWTLGQRLGETSSRWQEELTSVGKRLDETFSRWQEELTSVGKRLDEASSRWQKRLASVSEHLDKASYQWQEGLSDLGQRLGENISRWQEELVLARSELGERISQLGKISAEHAASNTTLSARGDLLLERADSLSRQLDFVTKTAFDETARAFQKSQQVAAELALQARLVTNLLNEVGARLPDGPLEEAQLRTMVGEKSHLLDAFYASFDEQFRGSREGIMERLKVYLPYVQSEKTPEATPVLDVGCGRGEWLELLRQHGLPATGVDSNTVLIRQCRERALEVVEDDLLDYLRKLPDESIGTLTGFHIVEHLPLEVLIAFLNETMRVLRPGRPIIFETPNPRNVLVGSCNFYFDPTHQNPLPSEVLKFLVESRGFTGVDILPLNPSDEMPVAGDSDLVARFNQYFYGPMDYGLVAWKSADDRRWTMDDARTSEKHKGC